MVIGPSYDKSWDYSDENNQQALINYEEGMEKLIIGVGLGQENKGDVAWIFPVPADPNKVAVDVLTTMPMLEGYDVSERAKSNLSGINAFLFITQIYPFPFALSNMFFSVATYSGVGTPLGASSGKSLEQDVNVYEHIEKEGITSEIITAKTANGLYDYLSNKGLRVEKGSIPVLDHYIGKDYTFVISWISYPEQLNQVINNEIANNISIYFRSLIKQSARFADIVTDLEIKYPDSFGSYEGTVYLKSFENSPALQELTQKIKDDPSLVKGYFNIKKIEQLNQRSIFVSFPTEEIYFPMLPTSVYGSKVVPATIRVIGHVSPKTYQDIKSFTNTRYYIDMYSSSFSEDLKGFYNGDLDNIKYTKIEINAPSKFLTEDLWIENKAPLKTYYSSFIATHPIAVGLFLFLITSIFVGIITGWIVFKDLRKNIIGLVGIGLFNCFSIIGLILRTIFATTKEISSEAKQLLDEIHKKGYVLKRKIAFLIFVFDIPILIVSLISFLDSIKYYYYDYDPHIIILSITTGLFVFAFIIQSIRTDDKHLFKQLKTMGFSSWSFQPKDNRKLIFITLFSVSFLIVSWALIKILELTI